MLDKLNSVEANYEELTALLATPAVQSDSQEYRKHAKALAEIEPLVEKYREYKSVLKEIEQAEEPLATPTCAGSPAKSCAGSRSAARRSWPKSRSF
jgi:protein subunit release factor A